MKAITKRFYKYLKIKENNNNKEHIHKFQKNMMNQKLLKKLN